MLNPPFDEIRPDRNDLQTARAAASLSRQDAAELCGLSVRRWRDIERGRARVPLAVYRLLVARGGWVPDVAWSGWRIARGELWSPEGQRYRPADLYEAHWLHQALADCRQRQALRP